MKKALVLISVFLQITSAQIVLPYPKLSLTNESLDQLNVSGKERVCQSNGAIAVTYLDRKQSTPINSVRAPNLIVCLDNAHRRIMSIYAEPTESYLEEFGVSFSAFWEDLGEGTGYGDNNTRFYPTDLDHNGNGTYWFVDYTTGKLRELIWDWPSKGLIEGRTLGVLNHPISLTAIKKTATSDEYEIIVLEDETGVISVFDSKNGTKLRSTKKDSFKALIAIASASNPFAFSGDLNSFYAITKSKILKIDRETFEVIAEFDGKWPSNIFDNVAVASNGEVIVSRIASGQLKAFSPDLKNKLWETPVHSAKYIDGGLPVFDVPQTVEPYFEYLLVGGNMNETNGIRTVKYHTNTPMTPKVVDLIQDCKGNKEITVTHINPNPGRIYTSPEKSYVIVDGVRTDWAWSWNPSNGENGIQLKVSFHDKFEWFFDGSYISSDNLQPSNTCPTEPIIPKLIQLEKYCDDLFDGESYYKIHLGYNNPNTDVFNTPDLGNSSAVKFYPTNEFEFYQTFYSPKVFYPGYHTSLDQNPKIDPIVVAEKDMIEAKNINFFSWSILDRITSRFPEKDFVNNCGVLNTPIVVRAKDEAINENNITKPAFEIKVSDLISNYENISIKYWFDKSEYPSQKVVADLYWSKFGYIQITPNENHVKITLPSDFILNSYNPISLGSIQLGIHFENYYPGNWNKYNDWSYIGLTSDLSPTQNITIYSNNNLIYGKEPSSNPIDYPSSSSSSQSSSSSSMNCESGEPGSEQCPFQIYPDQAFEIEMKTGEDVFVFSPAVWPGQNNYWWDPNIVLYLDKVANRTIPRVTVQDKYNNIETGGSWFHAVNISDEYPYLIRFIAKEEGRFTVRLSTF